MGHLGLAGETDGLDQMLADHPSYLDAFLQLQDSLMLGSGPLPEYQRRYIAIMAASRHGCSYLIEEEKRVFLDVGGPPEWLEGLKYAPDKIQHLNSANNILARCPWQYSQLDVESLLKVRWSVSELTQAVCILAQFHALCCFVQGCGIEATSREESVSSDCYMLHSASSNSGSPSSKELSEGGVDVLVERMKTLSMVTDTRNVSREQTRKSFARLKKQSECISTPQEPENCASHLCYDHLSPRTELSYQNHTVHCSNTELSVIRYQDYSWEDYCYSVLSDLYNEIGVLLDNKFKTAYSMTYYTCGDRTHVDTSLYRQAVWNYLQCLYGIRHDDYNYAEVDRLLDRGLKSFLKTVSFFPEQLTSSVSAPNVMKGFHQSEKIHVLVLAMEARLQAELLYALRAIGSYLM